GSYDTGAFRTGEYRTGAYDSSPQTGGYGSVDYPTGAYDTGYGYNYDPATETDAGAGGSTPYAGPATQSMPSVPPRGTPSLPAPRATSNNPDDDWPEPGRRRR
ncbi:MAG: hypothetical protein J2O46_09745, partial [Nocardioides sp.]|nr:hypothetical protein [Nocardioides sp.]